MGEQSDQRHSNLFDQIGRARTGRFLVSQGARLAASAASSLLGGLGIPLLTAIILVFIFTFIIVGVAGGPTDIGTTPAPSPGSSPSPSESITPIPPGRYCGTGSGFCLIENLRNYFSSEEKAKSASIICQKESGSNPGALNDGCLSGRSVDYSVGLFQINLLVSDRCPGAFSNYTWNPPSCTIENQSILRACQIRFSDPMENIRYASQLSQDGTSWSGWSTARVCGIIR